MENLNIKLEELQKKLQKISEQIKNGDDSVKVNKELRSVDAQLALIQFKKTYINLDEKNLKIASRKEIHLLYRLLQNDALAPLAKAFIIEAIASAAQPVYLAIIQEYTKENDPYIKDAAYKGLRYYTEAHFIKPFLNERLEKEKDPQIIQQIHRLLEENS